MAVPNVYTLNGVAEKIKAGEWDTWVDVLPTSFSFTNQSSVGQSAVITAPNTVTIAGLAAGVAAPISMSGGTTMQYSINGGGWGIGTTVSNGDTLQVRATSPATVSTTSNVVITVGAYSTTWQISTGADFSPNTFSFTNTNADPSTLTLSDTITVTGFNSPSRVSVTGTGATISVNGGFFVTSGNISDGDTLQIRLTSNATVNGTAAATVTLGTYSTTWTVTSVNPVTYVEDVFAPSLYNGAGAAQTVGTGIDFTAPASGNLMQGGLTWLKWRDGGSGTSPADNLTSNILVDTVRGGTKKLSSNRNLAESTFNTIDFNSTGFAFTGSSTETNGASQAYASWNFRRAKKFFDIVTYTGTGVARTVAHSLGVVPGMIMIKRLDTTSDWIAWHNQMSANNHIVLNSTNPTAVSTDMWNTTTPTASNFTVATNSAVNASGGSYIAYLFGHDTSEDSIIKCGFYSHGNREINLGWEPQFVMIKSITNGYGWIMSDDMRGLNETRNSQLYANTNGMEASTSQVIVRTANGFRIGSSFEAGFTDYSYIYMAIRKGPMRVPTDATKVFDVTFEAVSNTFNRLYGQIDDISDMMLNRAGLSTTGNPFIVDRLRGYGPDGGGSPILITNVASAETTPSAARPLVRQVNYGNGQSRSTIYTALTSTNDRNVQYAFKRAPGFFDQVCWVGNAVAGRQITHNLKAVPTMIWVRNRNTSANWQIYHVANGATTYQMFNGNIGAAVLTDAWNNTAPTNTVFTVGANAMNNANGNNYTAYLFADLPGISKAFSYTGNGTNQTIDLGFAPRFIMIKRTDAAGDWYLWDSARGIVAVNDPYLLLNSTNAEVTTDGSVDPATGGFIVNQTTITNINVTITNSNLTWTTRVSNTPNNYNLAGVAYGNGKFVAVGLWSSIVTSTDGATWTNNTPSSSVFSQNATSIDYGANLFAVSSWGSGAYRIHTSPDGISWTERTHPFGANICNRIVYTGGTFIACGQNGYLVTSADGISWAQRTSGYSSGFNFYDAAFGNGIYVATGQSGSYSTSTNLSTWTARSSSSFSGLNMHTIAFGAGLFVAGGTNGRIATSPDGINWTTRTVDFAAAGSGSIGIVLSIRYGNGIFVAVSEYGVVNASVDGITWTKSAASVNFTDVAHGSGVVVGVGNTGGVASTTFASTPATYIGYAIA